MKQRVLLIIFSLYESVQQYRMNLLSVLFIIHAFALTAMARSRSIPSICLQPPPWSDGICTIEIEGFYYDPHINDCQMYVIGGCRSYRGQSFGSRQDCIATCVHGTRHIQDLRITE